MGTLFDKGRGAMGIRPGSDTEHDDEKDRDPEDTPETPPDEPRPPRIEDPPPQPDVQGPYVVSASRAHAHSQEGGRG
jgi:hypothetical protein